MLGVGRVLRGDFVVSMCWFLWGVVGVGWV